MKQRVAVFPAGSEIGLEINNALKFSTHFEAVGFSSVPSHADFVYNKVDNEVPYFTDDNFFEAFNRKLSEHKIDFVYPAYDEIHFFLMKNQDKINTPVVSSPEETVKISRYKSLTYKTFEAYGFVPRIYNAINDVCEFPVFLKPDDGCGARGVYLAKDGKSLKRAIDENPNRIICEYLPGEEYTVDCFTDFKGELVFVSQRTRNRIKSGISVNSSITPTLPEIQKIAVIINDRVKLIGAWFFQVKKDVNGKFKLLEFAPRIAGTMGLSRNRGVNFPLLTLFTFKELPVDVLINEYEIMVDRALISRYKIEYKYDRVYVDLDDTLIVNGKVNSLLMMFLYQAVNNQVPITLLTRHVFEVTETLTKYKINLNLFDEIIKIADNQKKSFYIHEKNSIFIDDSFSERKDVSLVAKIPVFDCSEVEGLINWKI